MKKTIGILGGMGPLATADLLKKITLMTDASADTEHIRIYVDSNTAIPDRTEALLHGGKDPVPEMSSALRNLEKCGADCIVMPCNTAHAFLPKLQKLTDIPFLDMTEITADSCARRYPGQTGCLLATTGTLATGLYDEALNRHRIPFMLPDEDERLLLMYLIYDVVKASKPIDPEEEKWSRLLDSLRKRGADFFILACTELPILAGMLQVQGPFVDPTEELAKAAIEFCGYHVKNNHNIRNIQV